VEEDGTSAEVERLPKPRMLPQRKLAEQGAPGTGSGSVLLPQGYGLGMLLLAKSDLVFWVPKDNVKRAFSPNTPDSLSASEVQRPQFVFRRKILAHPLPSMRAVEFGYWNRVVMLFVGHENLIPRLPFKLSELVSHSYNFSGGELMPSVRLY
jgi:hypothetical protein